MIITRHTIPPKQVLDRSIEYLLRRLARAKILISNVGNNAGEIRKSFDNLWRLRPEVLRLALHLTISPAKHDRTSPKLFQQVIRFVCREAGIPNDQPLLSVWHELRDPDEIPQPEANDDHMHVLVSLVNDRGQLLKHIRSEYQFMQISRRAEPEFNLAITPGLEHMDPDELRLHFRAQKRLQENQPSHRDQLRFAIYTAVKKARAETTTGNLLDFVDAVEKQGVDPKFFAKDGELCGIGFRFNDLAVSGSSLCKNFSLRNLALTLYAKSRQFQKGVYENNSSPDA